MIAADEARVKLAKDFGAVAAYGGTAALQKYAAAAISSPDGLAAAAAAENGLLIEKLAIGAAATLFAVDVLQFGIALTKDVRETRLDATAREFGVTLATRFGAFVGARAGSAFGAGLADKISPAAVPICTLLAALWGAHVGKTLGAKVVEHGLALLSDE